MAQQGLERGKGGLQVYMMCEVSSNVFLAEKNLVIKVLQVLVVAVKHP